jgi:predicted AAA+ superfamily ATPase
MIARASAKEVLQRAKHRPVVFITGPRQCGKTTLAKNLFPHYKYVNLETEKMRAHIAADPQAFLAEIAKEPGVIIDEFQYVPSITSYIKAELDEMIGKRDHPLGFYILTGSQNFLMMEQVTQTLVGRAALVEMLPLSLAEAKPIDALEEVLFRGLYPYPYEQNKNYADIHQWAREYVTFYLERDAKTLRKEINIPLFHKFVQLLAGRVGQTLNINALATDCGIDTKMAQDWLGVLETCFVIVQTQPFYNNFSRRLIKSPKIYFVDTALVCYLLGITSPAEVLTNKLYGAIFENMIIMEQIKARTTVGENNNVYFWRDEQQLEVDALLHYSSHLRAVEIKATKTIKASLADNITHWAASLKAETDSQRYVIYGGEEDTVLDGVTWVSWRRCESVNMHQK